MLPWHLDLLAFKWAGLSAVLEPLAAVPRRHEFNMERGQGWRRGAPGQVIGDESDFKVPSVAVTLAKC